jgi:hypothetical protein
MRITSPFAHSIVPAPTRRTPQSRHHQPRFGITPIEHTDNRTAASGLAPKDTLVVIWAGALAVPTILFAGYKLNSWLWHRRENRRLNQAHERLLADAEAGHQNRQNEIQLEPIARPANALIMIR